MHNTPEGVSRERVASGIADLMRFHRAATSGVTLLLYVTTYATAIKEERISSRRPAAKHNICFILVKDKFHHAFFSGKYEMRLEEKHDDILPIL